ncbi:carbohydrate binding family 9 domain-containing protein [Pontibacter russatus]|uniref:carbohydrate binding family 9 domain-containing protein n=1 Tax=Pontibacter russatus TaxID=2694929 RepID=UPI00137B22AA|nr:carbohydrate binding family 9 domain-containing protein [Pontibacter russatus]
MIKEYCLLCLLGLLWLPALAQKKNEAYRLPIHKTTLPVHIDGVMDEAAWQDAAVAGDFFMVLPMDTSKARVRTEVRMTYDDQNLYLIAHCYKAVPGTYFVESLRRDFEFGKNDNFLLFMDPFDDQTNGFSFGANAAGAQWDGTMYGGGSVDLNWDNKWVSVVKNDPEKWVLEMAIPFTTIRYKKGITEWGINFSRNDLSTTEKSSWAPVPRQFPTASLAYSGVLVWDQPPPATGANVSVIPYVLGGVFKNHEAEKPPVYQKKAGADVKIGITSALNLDLTINPDFSQVEVDRQVTNLDRFELFFPERRQFFLENGDLFGNFGNTTIRPFFSRRIGLGVPIRAGARLSGKLNKDWRIGVMDMQTGPVEETGLPAQNFAIATLQRRVFARSSIGFLFVNKESLDYHPKQDTLQPTYSQYNRNIGLEYNLASSNNVWTGKAFVLKSFSPGKSGDDLVQAANLEYRSRHWTVQLQEEYVGENYTAEVGYVPRNNYFKINPVVSRLFFPRGGPVLSHGPKASLTYFFDNALNRTDNLNLLFYTLTFRTQSTFTVGLVDEYVHLLQPFDPTNMGRDTLARGTKHHWNAWRTEFVSKPQSVFTYAFNTRYGKYYENGTWLNLAGEAGYRFQPYVSVLASASYNDIRLPESWGDTKFWLVGSRVNVTMTNKLFFSTFLQYNEQTNNLNINTRFQWRYQPASDLYIVYTDNYFPAPFSIRSRALVLKLTYWWNR